MIKFKQRKCSFIITMKCLNNVVMINVISYPVLFFFYKLLFYGINFSKIVNREIPFDHVITCSRCMGY